MAQAEGRTEVIRRDDFSILLCRGCVLGCLLGLAGTLYFVAGLAGYLGNPLVNLAGASVTIVAGIVFIFILFVVLPERTGLGLLLWLLILSVFLIGVALGFLPPTARDELTHHLAIPKLYAKEGRIFNIPFASYSYYPMLLDMLYTPFVRWGWETVPRLVHGLFGFLTGLLLYAYLARRLNSVYGLLSLLFFVSTPAVLRLTHWAYVDLGVTFYVTAALLCLLRWLENKTELSWLMLAGLSAGFGMAAKPNGLLAFLVLFFLLAFFLGKDLGKRTGKAASSLVLFSLLGILPLIPWLLKNWFQSGNPFFPFFGNLFGSGGGSPVAVGGAGLGIFARRELLYGESGWQILALPVRVFFSGQDDNPQYFDGVLNPMLVLFLPWAFKGKWTQEKGFLLGFVILYFAYAIFLVDMRIRYILPIVPPLVILLVYGIHNIYLRIVRPSMLVAAVLLLLALNGLYLRNYLGEMAPANYLTGRESREAYLERALPDYPAFRYINQNLPEKAKIYFLFMGRRAYYCDRDYFFEPGGLPWVFLRAIQEARSREDIKAFLNERGITHLLVREDLLKDFFSTNLAPDKRAIWDSLTNHDLRRLFQDNVYSVYAIDA